MKSTNRKDWPGIPAGLKYVDLRLPGTFRELVANENFTNDQIGRIIRCIALDTDYFIDHDIEVEVRYYRQCLVSRNNTRLRVQACRKRRKEGAAGVLSSAMEKSVSSGSGASVTVTESAEKATSKSMTSIIQNYGVKHGIKLSAKNVSGNDTVESLPLYMAMFL